MSKNQKIILTIVIVIILALIVIALVHQSASTSVTTPPQQTQTSTTTTAVVAPTITSFNPAQAAAGAQVIMSGNGFDLTENEITFGTSTGRHHSDGTADNVITTAASPDGKTLTFTVPTSGPSGILCDQSNHCVAISALRMLPGTYPVSVINKNGTSTPVMFTVTR